MVLSTSTIDLVCERARPHGAFNRNGERWSIARRAAGVALTALVVGGFAPAVPASAGTGQAKTPGSSARAVVRGVDLDLFGSTVGIETLTAAIDAGPQAKASGAGVALDTGTASRTSVDARDKRQASVACLPELTLFEILEMKMACGESRVQTLPPLFTADFPRHTGAALLDPSVRGASVAPEVVDNGGPQAVGGGSVASADIRDKRVLQPAIEMLGSLLDALAAEPDQAVGAAAGRIGPSLGSTVEALAANLGLRTTDTVRPVSTLLRKLLDGTGTATGLLSLKLTGSTATTNTDADSVVALAATGGGQLDLLPGLAPGGAPLLSVIFGASTATSSYDRTTTVRTPAFEPGVTTVRFGLPLLGAGVTEVTVRPDAPLTVLAGTPLETTITFGGGRTVKNPDGSVTAFAEGASVQMIKGLTGGAKSGIDLRLGHAEAGTARPRILGAGPDRGLALLGATLALLTVLALLVLVVRRRRPAGALGVVDG